ncbi:MAG TPA: thiamine pyrophosphate-binding protein [Acidimicrobiia bacterium]
MTTGADAVAAVLAATGTTVAFGVPGVHNHALWPACTRAGIRVVGARHEQGVAFAADGYARVTGDVGIALVTTGPGAANTIGAVGEAWAGRAPVVVIASDVATTIRRPGLVRGSLHEARDQAALFRPVTKATLEVPDAEGVGPAIAVARTLALAPPSGPVYAGIPTDLLTGPAPAPPLTLPPTEPPAVDPDALARAVELLRAARRPVVWVGGGARDAPDPVARVAVQLGAPVVTTFQGRGVLPASHPLLVGAPPHEPAVTALLERADAALVVGSDLDGPNTQNWALPLPSTTIAVNVDPEDATKNYAMDVVLEADASGALDAVTRALHDAESAAREPWADVATTRRAVRADLDSDAGTAAGIAFVDRSAAALPEDAIVFADMAVPGYWLAGYLPVARPRALHYPMGWGTLGFAFPAALGAASAAPTRPVVSFSGDGGFLFATGELAALAQERSPVTAVVVDDGGYGMLRWGRAAEELDGLGTELRTPDFAAVARAFGVDAQTVDGFGDDYQRALAEAVTAGAPRLLHVRGSLVPPRTTSPRWPRRAH